MILPNFAYQVEAHGKASVMFPEPLATWIEFSKALDQSEYAYTKVTLDDADVARLEDLLSELLAFEAAMRIA